jgi:3-hydroxyacyl-CoA dehydrogenase/enoyl-CoA hydratase/3-hydroxybutyryl-CoA epimerase
VLNDGSRIAYVNAKAGIDVVLKDVSSKSGKWKRLYKDTRAKKIKNGYTTKPK